MAGFTLKQIADQMYTTCPELRWITLDADGVKGWSGTTRPRWTSGFWAGRMAFSIEMDPSGIILPPTYKGRVDSQGRPDWRRMLWEAPVDRLKVADEMAKRSWSTTRRHRVKAIGDGIDIVFDSYEECAAEFGLKGYQVKKLIERDEPVPGTNGIYLDEPLD